MLINPAHCLQERARVAIEIQCAAVSNLERSRPVFWDANWRKIAAVRNTQNSVSKVGESLLQDISTRIGIGNDQGGLL